MVLNKYIVLIGLLFISAISVAKSNESAKVMESFEQGIPNGMKATGGKLSIDTKRVKHNSHSLRWDWVGNDKLIFNTPIGYHKRRDIKTLTKEGRDKYLFTGHYNFDVSTAPILEPSRGFFMWIYNEKASLQRLRFQFGRGEKVDSNFDFELNFSGWRTVMINYDTGDMRGVPHPDMDRMTILAPATGSGSYYIDSLGLSLPMDARTNMPNKQLPHIQLHPRRATQYVQFLHQYASFKPSLPLLPLTDVMNDELNAFNKKVDEYILPLSERKILSKKNLSDIRKRYQEYKIQREGNNIYGQPLIKATIYNQYFAEMGEELPKPNEYMNWRRDYGQMMLDIAKHYRSSNNPKAKSELGNMFINLFDYGVDQGMDEGAALSWLHHYAYIVREWGPALYLMRDVFEQSGKLDKAVNVLKYFLGFNQVYREDFRYGSENGIRLGQDADDAQGLIQIRLYSALMMKNSPEKVRDLQHFSSHFSHVASAYAYGLDEMLKPDGTVFRHAGHTLGYGGRGINGMATTMYLLSHSPFKVTPEAHHRIKHCAETYFHTLATEKYIAPRAVESLRNVGKYVLPSTVYAMPAMIALSADTFDQSMAGLYKNIIEKQPKISEKDKMWLSKLNDKGEFTDYIYDKARVLPYSSVATTRNANKWMATVRAHSKYVYPYEGWGPDYFAFPAYLAHGYLDISYQNSVDSTYETITPKAKSSWQDGYDWRRFPGITAVRLPYQQLLTAPNQVRDEGGEYLFSDQAFVGGVETLSGNATFAFPFRGHDKWGLESFTGRKSYFFFNDIVVSLGSGIESDIDNYAVETTLLQNKVVKEEGLTTSSGIITVLPFNDIKQSMDPLWLLDSRNTGYYIPRVPKNASLEIKRQRQTNPGPHNKKQVSGEFSTVLFNHGIKPQHAGYEYAVIADANKEKMARFINAMRSDRKPYEILQQDDKAHIVTSAIANSTSYIVFDANILFDKGLVRKVSRPASFILEQGKAGEVLKLAVADPDLNIYDGQDDRLPNGKRVELSIYEREWYFWPSRATKVRITLQGEWKIAQQLKEIETAHQKKAKIIKSDSSQTIIEFECKDGLTAEVLLSKK